MVMARMPGQLRLRQGWTWFEDGGSGEAWEAYSLVVWREAASSMADPPRSGKATVETKQQEG